jgi:hypothetical protein
MGEKQSTVKPVVHWITKWTGKDQIEMADILGPATGAFLFFGPFIVLAAAAAIFGVDSRPGIDDNGPRRWMP